MFVIVVITHKFVVLLGRDIIAFERHPHVMFPFANIPWFV
jgi:hypothetical protein